MTQRPNIRQQITFLPTLDLRKTADFYENVLNLSLKLDQKSCRIYSTVGECYIGFCQRDFRNNCDDIILTLVTDEVDQWAEFLVNNGVNLDTEPEINKTYQIYHFYFRDPNGYKIEVQKFLHPFGVESPAKLI